MKKITAISLGALLALFTGLASAQVYRHELSLFGAYDRVDEPAETTLSIFSLRYGHYLRPQVLATLGLTRTNFDGGGADSTTMALTGGAKYYFGVPANRALLPFVEAAVGIATVDTQGNDSTDLTWEFGGGASFFVSDATSVDASLRFYQTDTDGGDNEGMRLFLGMSTRF